jgi:hypothetical protein
MGGRHLPQQNLQLAFLLGFFDAGEMAVRAEARKIDQHGDHVRYNPRSRSDQQAVVDLENLKDSHACA